MGKKIALLILGLTLVLVVFTAYQYVTGAGGGGMKPKIKIVNPPTTLPMYWEERLPSGVLQYVITAAKAPELLRDKAGQTMPGHFRVEKPLATYYDPSGRIVQISADEFRVVVDQGPKGSGGLPGTGGKGGGALTIRGGELEGHVRMILTAKPGGGTNPLDGGLRVYCDGILELDGTQETLTTTGAVHVRSERRGEKEGRMAFDGRGMLIIMNRKEKRLDYLGIEKGEKLVLRDVPTKGLTFLEPTTRENATAAASKPGKEASPAMTYRLTLGEEVKASMDKSMLSSERLYLLFTTAKEMLGDTRPASGPATATAPAPPATTIDPGPSVPPVMMIPEAPEAIAAANPEDLVVTWKGPMELRPADDKDAKLAGPRDVVVEALGAGAKPVTVSDPRFEMQTGRLWYHGDEQRVLLEPRDFKKVVLSALTGPNRGSVECGTVSLDQKTNHAVLTGPGTMVAKSTKEGGMATTVTWKTHMDLDLESAADAKDASKKTLAIRRAVLDGVTIKNDAFDLKADVLDALIANVTDKGKPVQKLEKMLATGNVLVHSYRKGAGSERGGLQAKQMEILTARQGDSAVPEPSQLTALGDVVAWQNVDKSKGVGAPAMQKETITAPKLVATLVPKARSATAAAGDNGFAGMDETPDVSRFVASDGARVEIVPPAGSKLGTIVATAGTIDGQPLVGMATLSAGAGASPVRIAMGENTVEGPTIALDNNKRSLVVLQAGVFHFTLPPDKARKTAMPMVVTWQGSMTYDDLKHLAVFTGQPVARVLPLPGAADQSDQASLKCEKTLTVQLKEGASSATTSAPASGPGLIAGSGLDLDWIQADGNVDARGVQLGADNKPLTRVRLSGPTLRYSKSDNAFVVDGAGALVFEDFRADKPETKMSTAGESDFNWQGSLKYDGKNNVITLTKNVDYFFKPVKPFNINSGARGAATAPAGPRQPDILRLHTDQLVATLAASKDGGKVIENPIGLGAGGNQEVSRVDAKGGVQFTIGTYRITNGAMAIEPTWLVAGDSMTFDVPGRIGTITGKGEEGAMAQRVGSGSMSGRSVIFDAAKNYLEVVDWQGRVSNFGG